MRGGRLLLGTLVLVGAIGALGAPLDAQQRPVKGRRVTTGPDADGDGVPDSLDRCPGTPAGQRVGSDGCPLRLLAPGEQAPATAATFAPRPANVTTQAAVHAAAPAAGAFTAGLSVAPYAGTTDADRDAYVARFTQMLDSAVVALVGVFRNTTGQPVSGAEGPASLSQRERDRWAHCRDLHFDLQSYPAAFHDLMAHLPQAALVQRAAAALDSALSMMPATSECDNLASMIEAPGRWTPWSNQYEAAAQRFYHDWYNQVRDADDRNRAFAMAFNAGRPATARIAVAPALPRMPPYVGGGPR
jgi:hypothetical protein